MTALYGLAALAVYVVALMGWRMTRDRGLVERFDAIAEVGGTSRRSLTARAFDRLGTWGAPVVWRVQLTTEERQAKVRRRLDAAGRPFGLDVRRYAHRKGAWGMLGLLVALLLLLRGTPIPAVLIAIFGWIVLDMQIDGRGRRRQGRIDRDLPDFLDVLSVCVNAGIAFRPAMARVSEGLGGPVGQEVDLTLRQIALGAPRREAFEALRQRNTSESIGSFVTALLQAEELGVPLADALNDLARDMRQEAYQRARRRAQQVAPRVSLVVTTLIMPAAVALIVGSLLVGNAGGLGGLTGP